MLDLVITGGQTGGDQAAWEAARACGIRRGGMMPLGYRTAAGDRPDFAGLHGATEHTSRDWPPRTEANVEAGDATVILNRGVTWSRGTLLAERLCRAHKRPRIILDPDTELDLDGRPCPPVRLAGWIVGHAVQMLNVAGNREPDPWPEAIRYLGQVFGLLVLAGHARAEPPWPAVDSLLCSFARRVGPAGAAQALAGGAYR